MRTFLTYVLAAAAAVLAGAVSLGFFLWKEVFLAAETGVGVGTILAAILGLCAAVPFILIFFGTVWIASKGAAGRVGYKVAGIQNLWLGTAIGLCISLSLSGSILLQGASGFLSDFGIAGMLGLLTFGFLPAAIWGAVFWMRTPRQPEAVPA